MNADDKVTLAGIVACIAAFIAILGISTCGCAALEKVAPSLIDVTERVIRAELDRAEEAKADASEVERLQLVLDVVRACREAKEAAERAGDEARAEAERARVAGEEAAARAATAAEDAQSAARLGQAHAEAAAAAEKAAEASKREAEATARAAQLEQRLVELVPRALGEADAGAGGGA